MAYLGRSLTAHRPISRESSPSSTAARFVLVCLAIHVTCLAVWHGSAHHPNARTFLFDEDRFVEMSSAALFLGAGLYAMILLHARKALPLDRLALAGVAILGVIGCLDEISFGERVLEFEVYELAGTRIDGVHDFVEVANTLRRDWFGPIDIVEKLVWVAVASAILVASACVLAWIATAARRTAPNCLRLPALMLGCAFLLEFGLSSLIDIRALAFDGDQATEEVGEMNMALLLLGLGGAIGREAPREAIEPKSGR